MWFRTVPRRGEVKFTSPRCLSALKGTLVLISGTSWALQWLIGALPAGWVQTRNTGSPLHEWRLETNKQHSFTNYIVFTFSSVCFLRGRFDAYRDFPASPTCFELSAVFNSSLQIGGVTTHLAPASAQIRYFLQLEGVEKKNPCHCRLNMCWP